MGRLIQTEWNVFDGGLSDSLRERTLTKFGLTKHFDTFSDGKKLIPYHSTEAEASVSATPSGETSIKKYSPTKWITGINGKQYAMGLKPVFPIDNYPISNYGSGVSVDGTNKYWGASFANTIESVLDSIKVYLIKTGNPTGSVYIKVYAHTGTYGSGGLPTGAALATSDAIPVASLRTAHTSSADIGTRLVNFFFSAANRITLSADTKYCFSIFYNDADSANYLGLGVDDSSPTHAGNAFYSTDGSSWTANGSVDPIFYVYSSTSQGTAVPGTILKVLKRDNPILGSWLTTTNEDGTLGNSEKWRDSFVEWQNKLIGFAGTQSIVMYDLDGGTGAFNETPTGGTLSEAIRSCSHSFIGPDNNLYMFYNNLTVRITPALLIQDDVCGAIPSEERIQSVDVYGSFLAIGTAYGGYDWHPPIGRSRVYIWDMVTDTTVNQVVDWGEGALMVLGQIEGYLAGISDKYLSSNLGAGNGMMVIRIWSGGIARVWKEIVATQVVPEGRFLKQKIIKNNKIYWVASVPFRGSTSTESTFQLGIWVFGRKSNGYEFGVALDYICENVDSSNFFINAFGSAGNYWWINHSSDFTVEITDLDNYSFSSIADSQIYGNAKDTKELKKVVVNMEALPAAGTMVLQYQINSSGTWTTIFTESTDNAIRHESINIEATGAEFGQYNEVQFRIKSTGGAVPIQLYFLEEIIEDTLMTP